MRGPPLSRAASSDARDLRGRVLGLDPRPGGRVVRFLQDEVREGSEAEAEGDPAPKSIVQNARTFAVCGLRVGWGKGQPRIGWSPEL